MTTQNLFSRSGLSSISIIAKNLDNCLQVFTDEKRDVMELHYLNHISALSGDYIKAKFPVPAPVVTPPVPVVNTPVSDVNTPPPVVNTPVVPVVDEVLPKSEVLTPQ